MHHGGVRVFVDAGFVHGGIEVCEPPSGLVGADQPMDVPALHANVSDAARLASEDRLEELLETIPFTRPPAAEQTGELRITLETVVEAIDDQADLGAAPSATNSSGPVLNGSGRRGARSASHRSLQDATVAGTPMSDEVSTETQRPGACAPGLRFAVFSVSRC